VAVAWFSYKGTAYEADELHLNNIRGSVIKLPDGTFVKCDGDVMMSAPQQFDVEVVTPADAKNRKIFEAKKR
jgi:hypothetical protein